jgi:hypothetical protein
LYLKTGQINLKNDAEKRLVLATKKQKEQTIIHLQHETVAK